MKYVKMTHKLRRPSRIIMRSGYRPNEVARNEYETESDNYVCPEPIRVPILVSNASLLIGISGVWKGFFMTASEYISYTFCNIVSAVVSASEVSRTNLVPIRRRQPNSHYSSKRGTRL